MKWAIDPNHSVAQFTIRHMMAKVRGTISIKDGWLEGEDHATAKVDVTLDPATINTGVAIRDNHLRSADGFFDVANYPTITFTSKKIEGIDPAGSHRRVLSVLGGGAAARRSRLETCCTAPSTVSLSASAGWNRSQISSRRLPPLSTRERPATRSSHS